MSQKKLVLNVTDKSYQEIETMANQLNTNSAGVISQALALFMMVQGKKIVISDQKENKNLEITTYANQPAQAKKGNG